MDKRILIVDDHAPTRSLMRAMLQADRTTQYEVVEARSGSECILKFERDGPFDLVLMDVDMPDMNGYEACQALRRAGAATPIVFVTAKGGLDDFHSARAAGGDSFLKKPVTRQALRSIVSLFTSIDRRRGNTATDGA